MAVSPRPRRRRFTFAFVLLFLSMCAVNAEAVEIPERTNCPPSSIGGPAVAHIDFQGVRTPLKEISRSIDGALAPPATNSAAGIDQDAVPLSAAQGTAVIAWHVRFGPGCRGSLNPLSIAPLGARFSITRRGGVPVEYVITGRDAAPSDHLPQRWFRLRGEFRVGLFTCGDLQAGRFRSTVATFAEPVHPVSSQL